MPRLSHTQVTGCSIRPCRRRCWLLSFAAPRLKEPVFWGGVLHPQVERY